MARFLFRSLVSTVITMLLVSMLLFFLLEVGGRDVTVRILGIESTPAQRESLRLQLGLDQSAPKRYKNWLIGNEREAENVTGMELVTLPNEKTGEAEWWADVDGTYTRWRMTDGEMVAFQRQVDGSSIQVADEVEWTVDENGRETFWGVNLNNSAAYWVRGEGADVFKTSFAGDRVEGDGPQKYIPLSRGILRGDAGESTSSGRPVSSTLPNRVRNTFILAGIAFIIVMPLALALGILAGINEGKWLDRIISITGLAFTATPEFVTGIILIVIFADTLRWFPASFLALSNDAIFQSPRQLVLPILTLTLVELGYVARMTRASMVEVMDSAYVRTAIIKGMPYRRVVFRHAVRNALMAPITVIMLHVNYFVSGIVVVEIIFGIPGLGNYIFNSAINNDVNAVEAAAMVTVVIAVMTRLLGDIAYTLINPRVRFS